MRCVVCGVTVDPSTGFLVGHPQRFAMCGRHAREALATLRWATGRRPQRGQPDFYAHASRSTPEQEQPEFRQDADSACRNSRNSRCI